MGESAADEARRQFAEIQQGLQARYGGTTGTGAFATELAGREFSKNATAIRSQVANVIAQADDKLLQVKQMADVAAKEIENNTNSQVSQLRDNLQQALNAIRQEKGQLQTWKSQKAVEAIQSYQNQAAQIRESNTQFLRDLYMQQQQAEATLKERMTSARQAAESFKNQNIMVPGQQTPLGVRQGSRGTTTDLSGNVMSIPQGSYFAGSYSPNQDDDLTALLERAAASGGGSL